jgi:enoyl-[acyl-carrier protein] reductase II
MLAAMALGADGVQIGSRFAASTESSAHDNFKQSIIEANDGSTKLTLKKLVPVRLIKNEFFERVERAENNGASVDKLKEMLGKGRAKKGMFEGDLIEGELEIGQISGYINKIQPIAEIMEEIITEFHQAKSELKDFQF